jgi:5-methylcytosine-specific restriction endonuclease McrA
LGKSLKEQGWYHERAWRNIRKLAMHRDKYLCQHCLQKGTIRLASTVHHKKPLEEYPELGLELGNLESVCFTCHELTKRRKKREIPTGVRVIKA